MACAQLGYSAYNAFSWYAGTSNEWGIAAPGIYLDQVQCQGVLVGCVNPILPSVGQGAGQGWGL